MKYVQALKDLLQYLIIYNYSKIVLLTTFRADEWLRLNLRFIEFAVV